MTAQYCNCYVNFSVFVEKKMILVCRKKRVLRVCSHFQEKEGKHVFYDININDLKLILSYMV